MNPHITFENASDEVTYALTHGPTPDVQDWDIIESGVDDELTAWSVIEINGRRYEIKVTAEDQPGSYDIGHGIPGRVA